MAGTRDVIVDHKDKVWFPVRFPGNHAKMARFDPVTEKLEAIEGVGGQFVARKFNVRAVALSGLIQCDRHIVPPVPL